MNGETSAFLDEFAQPIRLREHFVDSTAILAPVPNQPLPVICDYVFFETGSPLFLSASLYFDGSNSGFTNHNVINVEILLASFTGDIMKDAIASFAQYFIGFLHTAPLCLARAAKQAGVSRFLFSSSCIMYGMSEAAVVNETAPLAPQTEYARSKHIAETALNELADDDFSPTFCRPMSMQLRM